MNRNRSFFVDTSAWVALFSNDDKYHVAANEFWKSVPQNHWQILTNDYILDETYTLLRREQNGLQRAILAHQVIEESHLVESLEVSTQDRQRGWELFTTYTEKFISFTDCICIAMLHQLGVYQVFSFDSDFVRAGFVVKP